MAKPETSGKRKQVMIDEQLNQTREVPRNFETDADRKDLWMSKDQIRQNKEWAQEMKMMERTKELVKAKLVEEVVVYNNNNNDENHNPEEILLSQVEALQKKLNQIMSGSKEDILAFLQTKFNWITDSTDYWDELPSNIQSAASVLGYTKELWDDFSQQLDIFDKSWDEMTTDQQQAASELGYNIVTWNASLGVDAPMVPEEPDLLEKPSEVDNDEPMYDWGNTTDDSSTDQESHSERSGTNSDTEEYDDEVDVHPEAVVNKSQSLISGTLESVADEDEDEFIANFILQSTEKEQDEKVAVVEVNEKTENAKENEEEKEDPSSVMEWLDSKLPNGWPLMAAATVLTVGCAMFTWKSGGSLRSMRR